MRKIPVDVFIVCKCGATFTDRVVADEHWEANHVWEDQVDM